MVLIPHMRDQKSLGHFVGRRYSASSATQGLNPEQFCAAKLVEGWASKEMNRKGSFMALLLPGLGQKESEMFRIKKVYIEGVSSFFVKPVISSLNGPSQSEVTIFSGRQ